MHVPITRREALGAVAAIGTVAALADTTAAAGEAVAQAPSEPSAQDGPQDQYGFLFRIDHCIDCGECVTACRAIHGTPEGIPGRREMLPFATSLGGTAVISVACMHCESPACAEVCPASAIAKGAGGIVEVDPDRCIGCKYCYEACPYGVPRYNNVSMYKCDYCRSVGVPLGERTYCVHACHVDALLCGKVDELTASYPRAVRIEGPTGASSYLDAGTLGGIAGGDGQ